MKKIDTSIFFLRYKDKFSNIGLIYFFVFIFSLLNFGMLFLAGMLRDDEYVLDNIWNLGFGSLLFLFLASAVIVYATYRAMLYYSGIYYKKSILAPVVRKVFETEDVKMLPGESLDESVLKGSNLFYGFNDYDVCGEDLFVGAAGMLNFGFCDVSLNSKLDEDTPSIIIMKGIAMDMELLSASMHYQQLTAKGADVVVRAFRMNRFDACVGTDAVLDGRLNLEWCDELANFMGQDRERGNGVLLKVFGTNCEGTRQMLSTATQRVVARIVEGVMECGCMAGVTINIKDGHIRVLLHLKSLDEDVFDIRPMEFFKPEEKAMRDIDVISTIAGIIDDVRAFASEMVAEDGRGTMRRIVPPEHTSVQERMMDFEAKYKSRTGCYNSIEVILGVLAVGAIGHVAYYEYTHADVGIMLATAYLVVLMLSVTLFGYVCGREGKYRFSLKMYVSLMVFLFAAWCMNSKVVTSDSESQEERSSVVYSTPRFDSKADEIDCLLEKDVDSLSLKGRWAYIGRRSLSSFHPRSFIVLIPDTIRRMVVSKDRQVHQVCLACRDTLYADEISNVAGYGRLRLLDCLYKNGRKDMSVYVGEVWKGKPNGYGVQFCSDDIKKEGFWQDGKPVMYKYTSPRMIKYVCLLDEEGAKGETVEIRVNSKGSLFDSKLNRIAPESQDYPLYAGIKSAVDRYITVSRRATAENYRILKPIMKKYSRKVD